MPRYLTFFVLLFAPVTALACGAPSHLLTAPPQQILRGLEKNNAPYLAAMDDYSIAMEACYDGPQGPLQLAPHAVYLICDLRLLLQKLQNPFLHLHLSVFLLQSIRLHR